MDDTAGLRRDAGRLHAGVGWLVVGLGVLLVLERFGPFLTPLLRGADWAAAGADVGAACVLAVAPVMYLIGLWRMRPALAALRDGGLFASAISSALARVAPLLVAGAIIDVAVVPSVLTWLGRGPGYVVALDFSSFAVAALGAVLFLLARLIQRAAALKADLDAFF